MKITSAKPGPAFRIELGLDELRKLTAILGGLSGGALSGTFDMYDDCETALEEHDEGCPNPYVLQYEGRDERGLAPRLEEQG